MVERFDLVVVGAGAAGLSVAYGAARLGFSVALVERGEMGGECLNSGCVPSKTMLAAARRGFSWAQAQAEIRRAVASIAPADSQARYEALGVTVIRGAARFTGRLALAVGERNIAGRWVVVAAGSRPIVPEFLAGTRFLTNETVWALADKPKKLVILGGGPMAVEMADAFCSLGSAVTVVAGPRILPREDAELVAPVLAALAGRGVVFEFLRAVAAGPGGGLVLEDGREVAGDVVLVAAGRMVDIADLNPAAAGICWGPEGIRTDRRLRVAGTTKIFAAGDAACPQGVGAQRFTHVAGSHAGVILRQICFRLPGRVATAPPARVVFAAPELAQVGVTLAEAGPGARALVQNFAENDRAICAGDTSGLVKLVIDRRGRIIGAGIVGKGAGEMIGMYVLAVARRLKISALAGLVLPYPTRGEAGKRAAGVFVGEKLFSAGPRLLARLLARLP